MAIDGGITFDASGAPRLTESIGKQSKSQLLLELAAEKCGIDAHKLVPFNEEWLGPNDWSAAGTGGGSVQGSYSGSPGEYRCYTGAGAGSGHVVTTSTAGKFTSNLRKKWFLASRIWIGAPDANVQAFIGLQARVTTTSWVGIGYDGAVSTAKMLGGMFAGTNPAHAVVPGAYALSSKDPPSSLSADLSRVYVEAYVYNNGSRVFFSFDGEIDVPACDASALPAEGGVWVPMVINCTGGPAVVREMFVDFSFGASER